MNPEEKFYVDFLKTLNEVNIQYMIAGGHAVSYHGYEHLTEEMEIWFNPTRSNAQKLKQVFERFNYDTSDLHIEEMVKMDTHPIPVYNREGLGQLNFRSDIGADISFAEAYKRSHQNILFGHNVHIVSYEVLKQSKNYFGKMEDQLQLQKLEKVKQFEEERQES